MRGFVQDLWREVAYHDLNGAITASLSNSAIAMVKRTCFAVFADFPDYDSYETIIKTPGCGNLDKARGGPLLLVAQSTVQSPACPVAHVNGFYFQEMFLVNAYKDLLDFVVDYQKNRSGKPTKAMQAQIRYWDLGLDLTRATREERLRWRRSYTINWLYDLVNVFASPVVEHNKTKGEK